MRRSEMRCPEMQHRGRTLVLSFLLFAHASPFNRERALVFWSRMDPERDRFVVLPFLGSDWAVYRDFLVIEQGMFEAGRKWPPTRNEFAENSFGLMLWDYDGFIEVTDNSFVQNGTGIYQLTPKGQEGLALYADVVAALDASD